MDGLENLLFLLFILASALISWLQRRRQHEREINWEEVESQPTRHPSTGPKTEKSAREPSKSRRVISHWEEELRRLLEGESESSSPKKTTPPVPGRGDAMQPAQRHSTPPPITPEPTPASEHVTHSESTVWSMRSEMEMRGSELEKARREAARLHREAKDRLGKIRKRGLAPVAIQTTKPVLGRWGKRLRHPSSAREAIVLSAILGPPKALEKPPPAQERD